MHASKVTPPGRLLALDAFRGLTILGMILVNNPGSWSDLYWPVGHAEWHGWTPTDLVFPFFLFIVGASLAYSLRRVMAERAESGGRVPRAVYVRIVRRTIVLILLGLLLNFFWPVCSYLFGGGEPPTLATLRLPGVLQRIALVYLVVSLVVLHVGVRGQAVLAAVLLLGYWALLAWLPNPHDYQANLSPEGNVVRQIDRVIIGEAHMYTAGLREPTDPEGLLSTLPSIVTALFGYWCGLAILRYGANGRTVGWLVWAGVLCTAIGLAWDMVLPINKKLWTSSYVFLSGGLAMITLAACLLAFDLGRWRRLGRTLEIVGINAIFVYVASELSSVLLGTIRVGPTTIKGWLYDDLFVGPFADPRTASLVFAVATVAFWWLVLWAMARRGWTVRV